jgi:hypothetical protein
MRWTSIVANHELDTAVFSPPVFAHTPLEAFLEHLYEERADASAVMWSYRDFRHADPTIDTRPGVEFIGYEILKMAAVQTAVALLERNAADYPASATSAFELGRAYVTANHRREARRQFLRALALDPALDKARTALTALK